MGDEGIEENRKAQNEKPIRTLVALFLISFPEFLPVFPFSLKSPEYPYSKTCYVGEPRRSSLCSFQQGDKKIILSVTCNHLICARHFMCINLFNFHKNSILIISSL